MADLDFHGFGPDEAEGYRAVPRQGRLARILQTGGAVLSFALIAGLAVWGYKLVVRDVTGVPVVRALEGPMRIQPDEPGGDRAAHQGLAVNRIAAQGEAAPPAERIVLAPRSADLSSEDVARADLRPAPRMAPAPEAEQEAATLTPAALTLPEEDAGALAAPPGAEVPAAATAAAAAADLVVLPASVPGVSRSLRPRPRPAVDAALQLAAASAASAVAAVLPGEEIDAANLAPGTRLVQFGAYDSPEDARASWDRLSASFGSLMEGKNRVVEQAASGGRAFWRLRAAGFTDLADARRFCAAFVAEQTDCIPVVTR